MNLALFDFDGTLTERESFGEFMISAVAPRRLALGRLLLAPLVVGYRLGLLSGTWRRATRWWWCPARSTCTCRTGAGRTACS